ncbi:NAD(P)-dependent oxidoreductase [Paenibacillus sp. NEAU-GSW1]|uniref:NAD(P)-dependent oxidoreductase n=1 Tax=Paenibacillus sp. NEAU-GSW1 TaxID=2682486 RepID=UPI0012E0D682|nr:SDR family oxidoreductase [Paenibacillus sp. NEAU-GSW1]MUT67907.1 NAD(P)H-binding protein [Paenibacillus sp. NEAU-GSW1]
MKLIVFGATGRVGLQVVRQALKAGHEVTAYVRDPKRLVFGAHPNLKVIEGDALYLGYVKQAIEGQDAVINCIGSRGTGETTLMSDVMRNIIDGMKEHGVMRIGYVASAGIHGELKGPVGFILGYMLRHVLADHRRACELLEESGLQWTVARPMQLTDGDWTGIYRQADGSVPRKGRVISRADVAHFLLTTVASDANVRKSIGLAY